MGYFDVVKQYDAMRQSLVGPAQRAVVEAPDALFGPQVPAAPAPAPVAHHPGDGHNHGPAPAPKPTSTAARGPGLPLAPLRLAAWGGRQFDAPVIPKLQQLAAAFPGLRLTSGYRDPQHNAKVGGVKNSWHVKGRAADFVGSARDMAAANSWARANGAREVLVHNVGSGQHLHVAF